MPTRGYRCFVALGVVAFAAAALAGDKPAGLVKTAEVALPGDEDFAGIAVNGNRIYVAHGTRIDVLDRETRAKAGTVGNVDGARSIVILPASNKGFVTASKRSKLVAFALDTLTTTKEITTGEECSALLLVAKANEVWTFDHAGKTVTCVDPESMTAKTTIALEGKPSAAVEDPGKGVVYVALEDKGWICVLDVAKHSVVGTHMLHPGTEPHGLAFDETQGLLFAGCANEKLIVLDVNSWRLVASPEIREDCRGVTFDAASHVIYAPCPKGTAAFFVKDAKTLDPMPALAEARTSALDPQTGDLYLVADPKGGEKGPVRFLVFSHEKK